MLNIKEFHPQFITDESGKKQSVILPIRDFEGLLEDLEDLAIVAERREETTTNHADFLKELKNSGAL